MKSPRIRIKSLRIVLLLSLLLLSCSYKKTAAFPVYGAGPGRVLYALSKAGAAGTLSFADPKELSYTFEEALPVPRDYSLELTYTISEGEGLLRERTEELASGYQVLMRVAGEASWALPLDDSFLGIRGELPGSIRYVVPVSGPLLGDISFTLEKKGAPSAGIPAGEAVFQLRSLGLVPRWYGFAREAPSPEGGRGMFLATPFVFRENQDPAAPVFIDPPAQYRLSGPLSLSAEGVGEGAAAGRIRYEYAAGQGGPEDARGFKRPPFSVPPGALPPEPYPVMAGGAGLSSLRLGPAAVRDFPAEAVPADPGLILGYSREAWRDPRYEVFQWDAYPSILIFDTADYAVQERFFKRLAFFTEKAGFRGRLATDQELAGLHGWNAHDYRAEDLARFFEAARRSAFPLLPEEWELRAILLGADIIRGNGEGYSGGTGAVISISRESPDSLRSLFMVHEGFHGLFFIDGEFRDFSLRRWEQLPGPARRFILSYFDYQRYDVADSYLMVNEFMAHCLQQSVSLAGLYFGQTLAARIDASSWRRGVLPPKDEASGSWPELAGIFSAEAAAFSAYVNRRWGLSAGRVWQIRVRGE
ncbi:MAG: hypothetical protein LBP71_01560 [Spirochaetaceae bacterium]|jgi:hypothetical protein|nr:hypothetical protein [Spirochaetaceae bacterium]